MIYFFDGDDADEEEVVADADAEVAADDKDAA